jgi:hypothetical protein
MFAVVGISWFVTATAMSSLNVGPERGLHPTMLAAADKIPENFKLWWQSIAVLGNGDFFGRNLTFASGLAAACAVLSIAAVVLLPRVGWNEVRTRVPGMASPAARARLTFIVFWCSSALLLSVAFLLSATPVDIHSDRYLVGLIYAVAAVIPTVAVGRPRTEVAVLAGTCAFALGGVISMASGTVTRNSSRFVSRKTSDEIARIAAANHLKVGYAGYWEAAAITWTTNFRAHVYPVAVCDQYQHLCKFDLAVISSWYAPRPGIKSFLLADPLLPNGAAPTPDLGPPSAVYHIGSITMYAYPYDLATKIKP